MISKGYGFLGNLPFRFEFRLVSFAATFIASAFRIDVAVAAMSPIFQV